MQTADGIAKQREEPEGLTGESWASERKVALSLEHDAMLEEEMARGRMQEHENERARHLDIAHEERDRESEELEQRYAQMHEHEGEVKSHESDEQDSLDSASGDAFSGRSNSWGLQRKVLGLNKHHDMLMEEIDQAERTGQEEAGDSGKEGAGSMDGTQTVSNERSLQGISLREMATEWVSDQGRKPKSAREDLETADGGRYRGVLGEIYSEQKMAAYREAFADARRSVSSDVAYAGEEEGPDARKDHAAGPALRTDLEIAGTTSRGLERMEHQEPSAWVKKQALEKEFHYQRDKVPNRVQAHWDMHGRRIRAEAQDGAEKILDRGPLDGDALQRGASVGALEELELVLTENEGRSMEGKRDCEAGADEVHYDDKWAAEDADMIQKSVAAQREAERVIAKYKIKGVLSPTPAKDKAGATAIRLHTRQQLAFQEAPPPPGREGGRMDAEFHAGARGDHDRGDGAADGERARLPSEARRACGTAARFSLNGASREAMPVGARDSCSNHASRARDSPPATGLPSRQDSLLPEWERPARSSDTRQGPQKMIDAMTASTAELRAFLSNGAASSRATSSGADAAGGGLGTAGAGMSGSAPDVNVSQTPVRMPPRSWSSPSEDRGAVARAEQGSVGLSVREADGLYWQNVRGKEADVGAGCEDGKRANEESADDESGKHQQDPVMCLRALLDTPLFLPQPASSV